MQVVSVNLKNLSLTSQAIIKTLAFFDIYKLPLSSERIWQLLYRKETTLQEVEKELSDLTRRQIIVSRNNLYSLTNYDTGSYDSQNREIEKRWTKIRKYFWILSAIPFIEHVSVINSVAMGNADSESDIDFFVITKPNRLYIVRTMIIVIFKLLGVYKSRAHVNERFCFGFYVTINDTSLKEMLLPEEDPYMVFWLATIIPIIGEAQYQRFIKDNRWIYSFVPNFRPEQRLSIIKTLKPSTRLKRMLAFLLLPVSYFLEPFLRKIHIRHTFRLPENHWATSSTVANRDRLKLHAIDPRKDLKNQWLSRLPS